MNQSTDAPTVSEQLAAIIANLPEGAPPATQAVCQSLLIDIAGPEGVAPFIYYQF